MCGTWRSLRDAAGSGRCVSMSNSYPNANDPNDPAAGPAGFDASPASSPAAASSLPVSGQHEPPSSSSRTVLWAMLAILGVAVAGVLVFLFATGERSGGSDTAPAAVAVPDVVGFTEADAVNALRAAGFTVATEYTSAGKDVPGGTVLKQRPVAGSQVDSGSQVRLDVAALTVPVPDLRGLNERDATNLLLAAGLTVGRTSKESSKDPAGTVLSQAPAAGEPLEAGGPVDLVVSDGRQPIPDVVGKSEASARAQLADAGFRVEVVTKATGDAASDGLVLQMNPSAGRTANVDSTVVLTVGEYRPDPSPTPTATPTPTP